MARAVLTALLCQPPNGFADTEPNSWIRRQSLRTYWHKATKVHSKVKSRHRKTRAAYRTDQPSRSPRKTVVRRVNRAVKTPGWPQEPLGESLVQYSVQRP